MDLDWSQNCGVQLDREVRLLMRITLLCRWRRLAGRCALSGLLTISANPQLRLVQRSASSTSVRQKAVTTGLTNQWSRGRTHAEDSVQSGLARLAGARDDRLVSSYVVLDRARVAEVVDRVSFWVIDGKTPERLLLVAAAPATIAFTAGQLVCIRGIVLHIPDSPYANLSRIGGSATDDASTSMRHHPAADQTEPSGSDATAMLSRESS
jgi:hypothetical protein